MARSPGGSRGILRRPAGEGRRQVGVFQFFGEVINELKKVTWPTRQETTRLTVLVITVSVAIGAALGSLDFLFSRLLNVLL